MKSFKLTFLLTTIIWTFTHVQLTAQEFEWARNTGGNGNDYALQMCKDAAGNIFTTGYFDSPSISSGAAALTGKGGSDILITKYDPAGNLIWTKSAGGSGSEVAHTLCCDPAGNLYISGHFDSPEILFDEIRVTAKSTGSKDIFIAKYSPEGNALWAKSTGGGGDECGYSITVDPSGNIYIAGNYSSTEIKFESSTLANKGGCDLFIAKFDMSGNNVWTKSWGGDGFDYAAFITADAQGNLYLTGNFNSQTIPFDASVLSTNGEADIFIAKFDSKGNALWARSSGGGSTDCGESVTVDPEGHVFITGYFDSPEIYFNTIRIKNKGVETDSLADLFIAKYDGNGNIMWARGSGGPGDDHGHSLTNDAAGNIFITGDFNSPVIAFGSTKLKNTKSDFDIFVSKYSTTGDVLWCKGIGGNNSDESKSIIAATDGSLYLTGYFNSPVIKSGKVTLSSSGGTDPCIIKLK